MRFNEFKQRVKNHLFFRSNIFPHLTSNTAMLRRQVSEWVKKGYLMQLKRGTYTLPEDLRAVKFSKYYLANQLYSPSYVSLESALSYYGVIPEQVNATLSITPKKTQQFTNHYGQFIYKHIKPHLFDDFIIRLDEFENQFFIATKEKAIVDFLYFKSRELNKFDEMIFQDSFRFQNVTDVNTEYLCDIANKYNNKKLNKLVALFVKVKGEL